MNSQVVFFLIIVIAAIVMASLLGDVRANSRSEKDLDTRMELDLPVR